MGEEEIRAAYVVNKRQQLKTEESTSFIQICAAEKQQKLSIESNYVNVTTAKRRRGRPKKEKPEVVQVQKRGRGRPRRSETTGLKEKASTGADMPKKRGRGRPRKVLVDQKTAAEDSNPTSAALQDTPSTNSEKRGKGRIQISSCSVNKYMAMGSGIELRNDETTTIHIPVEISSKEDDRPQEESIKDIMGKKKTKERKVQSQKSDKDLSIDSKVDDNKSNSSILENAVITKKKGRGRPKKQRRVCDEDCNGTIVKNGCVKDHPTRNTISTTSRAIPTIKRGRGRPKKISAACSSVSSSKEADNSVDKSLDKSPELIDLDSVNLVEDRALYQNQFVAMDDDLSPF